MVMSRLTPTRRVVSVVAAVLVAITIVVALPVAVMATTVASVREDQHPRSTDAAQGPAAALTITIAAPTAVSETDQLEPEIGRVFAAYDAFIAEAVAQQHRDEQAAAAAASLSRHVASSPASIDQPSSPVDAGDRWDQLAQCESGSNWAYPPVAGGFSGGIMFHIGTWRANGGEQFAPDAYLASREQQIIIAERVLAVSGWRAWPGCSSKFGWI
jgi:hypothetical protein